MTILEKTAEENKHDNLTFVGLKVIECLKDAGADSFYIDGKIVEFSKLDNYASLHHALGMLDDKNKNRFAVKLGVPVSDLTATLLVLNKI